MMAKEMEKLRNRGKLKWKVKGKAHDKDHERGDSEEVRVESSSENQVNDQQMESEGKETESEENGQRVVTSHRREVIACDSAEDNNHYPDHENEDEEAYLAKMHREIGSNSSAWSILMVSCRSFVWH